MRKDDSDSAFPHVHLDYAGNEVWYQAGLTRRELLAAMAMQGLCANSIPGSHHRAEEHAREAVLNADALLKELDCD